MVRESQTKPNQSQSDVGATDILGALVSQALLSKAASLARKGEYEAAEALLKQLIGGENESPSVLDLLARINAQQGRITEAETLWKRALEREPNNQSYLAGLRRIARIRTRSLWAGVLPLLGAAVLAILVVSLVGFAVRDQIVQLRGSLLTEVARTKSAPPQTAQSGGTILLAPRITIQLIGADVETQQDALVVLFKQGLFLSRAELKPEAKTLLSELGRQLRPNSSNISVRIIGYTDNIPLSAGRVYRDNAALGMARAITVADYLSRDAGLPMRLFQLQSVGETQPLYPNDTHANRLRNRTAVIRIYGAENAEKGRP